MLRQYQIARAAAASAASSTGVGAEATSIWTLKERRDAAPHARPMSTKILAVGILLVGVLVLSVALIMGLEFPKYVHSQLREDQCVINEQHSKYTTWRLGTQWTREVHLYFWELVNLEGFLYLGESPQVQQRGPYVYVENETREDVYFNSGEASFRVRQGHVFSRDRTSQECGTCYENDTLTVLNVHYLREVFKTGGDVNYVLSSLASFLEDVFASSGLYLSGTFTSNVTLLGCLDNACDTYLSNSPYDLANMSFGKWVQTTNSSFCKVIRDSRANASFTLSELEGIYAALLNQSVLGTGLFSEEHADVRDQQCRKWASGLCRGVTSPEVEGCGLVHILEECGHRNTSAAHVQEVVSGFFCAVDTQCLNLSNASANAFFAYLEAFTDFVLQHLVKVVHNSVFLQRNRDLVIRMSQSELALGYYLPRDAGQTGIARRVQGLLVEDWLKSDDNAGVLWKVDTCLQDRNMNNNMKVREFNGSQYAPPSLLRDPLQSVTVQGQTDFIDACSPLTTCQDCSVPASTLSLYLPSLWRAVSYAYGDVTSLWGIDVYRYWLTADNFMWNPDYQVSCGLQSLTSALGFVGWIGVPKLTSAQLSSFGGTVKNCSLPQLDSFVDVELVSGRLWQKKTQLQVNVGLRAQDVSSPRWQPLNVTNLNKPIPLVWTDRRALLDSSELGFYNYKVVRLMRVSCGGLIGLSVVAAIVMIIGCVVFFRPTHINRVGPAPEESSITNLHSRHLNAN